MIRKLKALMTLRRGNAARRAGRLADAHDAFSQAVSNSRACGSRRLLIRALKGLGQSHRDSGHASDAIPLYEEAAGLCLEIGDQMMLAHTIRHLGDIYQDTDDMERAESCYAEALAVYRQNSSTRHADLANAVRPFALLKERLGDKAAAYELWTEAHRLYSSVNSQPGIDESASHLRDLSG